MAARNAASISKCVVPSKCALVLLLRSSARFSALCWFQGPWAARREKVRLRGKQGKKMSKVLITRDALLARKSFARRLTGTGWSYRRARACLCRSPAPAIRVRRAATRPPHQGMFTTTVDRTGAGRAGSVIDTGSAAGIAGFITSALVVVRCGRLTIGRGLWRTKSQ